MTLSKCLVNIDNCLRQYLKICPKVCKNVFLLVKMVFCFVRFVSKYTIVDKYCNIEISFGRYMDFSVC